MRFLDQNQSEFSFFQKKTKKNSKKKIALFITLVVSRANVLRSVDWKMVSSFMFCMIYDWL